MDEVTAALVVGAFTAAATVTSAFIAARPRRESLPPDAPANFTFAVTPTGSPLTKRESPVKQSRASHSLLSQKFSEWGADAANDAARIFDPIWSIMYRLPPFARRRSSLLAGTIGFLLGGIGLALYLRSLVDAVVPIAVAVGAAFLVSRIGGPAWFIGAGICALYGFFRVESSNRILTVNEAVRSNHGT